MKANKIVFWISNFAMLLSIVGIAVFTPLKACSVWCEVLMNICISLLGGAFLSSVVAFINFKSIKFQYERDFNTKYISCVNRIRKLANWFTHWEKKVDYDVKYPKNIENDFDKMAEIKMSVFQRNKPYIVDLYQRIDSISTFEFNSLFAITDDYCNSIWKIKECSIKGNLALMIKMVRKIKGYDCLENKSISQTITLYEDNSCEEYMLYKEVAPYFKELCSEDKMTELGTLQKELTTKTKINDKINKIYGNEK